MRELLIVTNLYPNANEPTRGIFIKQLVDRIGERVSVRVVAPVPWRPGVFEGESALPEKEVIDNIEVYHPRYIVIPKVLRSSYGYFFYKGIRSLVKKLNQEKKIDFISAHWVYPDGYACVRLANEMNIPVSVHALGCDINEYAKYENRKKRIVYALQNSSVNVVKSAELKNKITALGIKENKTHAILNGVDQTRFFPGDKLQARQKLGLDDNTRYALFIGNFQVEKGLTYLLDAVALAKDVPFQLLLVGGGRQEEAMKAKIESLGIADKVILVGRVPHNAIVDYMQAADLLCLPSLREGCPNVVLESLSCGTPVLASQVGAVPDILSDSRWGVMVPAQIPQAIADALPAALQLKDDQFPPFNWFSWQENAQKIIDVFDSLIDS